MERAFCARASRSFRVPCDRPPGKQHGGHRGRQVQARDALAHRDPDQLLGPRRELLAEPVALGAEGEHRSGAAGSRARSGAPSGSSASSGRGPSSISAGSRAASPAARSAGRRRPAARPDATGRGCRWSAPRLRRRRRPPARRRPCCRGRGDPRAGSPVPGGGSRAAPPGVQEGARRSPSPRCWAPAARAARTPPARCRWASASLGPRSGASASASSAQFVRIAGDEQLEARAEPERVLDRVEAFEHRQRTGRGGRGRSEGSAGRPSRADHSSPSPRTRVGRDEARGCPPHHRDHR